MERVLEAETDACVGLSRPGNGQGCSAGGRKLTRPFQWQREDRRPGRWPMSPGWEVPVPVAASRPRRRGTSRSFILRVLEARSQNQGVSRTMLPLSLPPPPEKTLEESCLFQVSGLPVSLELEGFAPRMDSLNTPARTFSRSRPGAPVLCPGGQRLRSWLKGIGTMV